MQDQPQNQNVSDTKNALIDIIQGSVGIGSDPSKMIISSNKFSNTALRALVDAYRKDPKNTDRYLLELVLSLDEAIEKGYLTNELLEEIKKNPDILTNELNKGNASTNF